MTTPHSDTGSVDEGIGRRVQQLMSEQHLTQAVVAKPLHIDQASLSRKLHGHRGWSSRDVVILADVLGTTPSWLLTGIGDPCSSSTDLPPPSAPPGKSKVRTRMARFRSTIAHRIS
jgi:transcriptional regulator with XRE-family HTH domain